MKDLKTIWNQREDNFQDYTEQRNNMFEGIIVRLKEEQRLLKKFRPFLFPYVLLIATFLFVISFRTMTFYEEWEKWLGIVLITLGGCVFMFLQIRDRWDLQQYSFELSNIDFCTSLISIINKKRRSQVIALWILFISLSIGIYLMIFGIQANLDDAPFILFYFLMITIGGRIGTKSTLRSFDEYYRFITNRIVSFTTEDEA